MLTYLTSGEKTYNDVTQFGSGPSLFSNNPYLRTYTSPYGQFQYTWGAKRPIPSCHASWIHTTIDINNRLNKEAQASIDEKEPKVSIWDDLSVEKVMADMKLGDNKSANGQYPNEKPVSYTHLTLPTKRIV